MFQITLKAPDVIKARVNREVATPWLRQLGNAAKNKAIRGMRSSPRSGRTYRRGNVVHVASSPGEYPRVHSGNLWKSFNVDTRGLEMIYGNSADYAVFLEQGTSKMAPRKLLEASLNEALVEVVVPENLMEIFAD